MGVQRSHCGDTVWELWGALGTGPAFVRRGGLPFRVHMDATPVFYENITKSTFFS